MQQLHLVGFTTDHDSLIFSGRKGAKSGGFVLPLDEELLATIADAVRRRLADGEELEVPQEILAPAAPAPRRQSQLSPREIQDRLRAGRSLEAIAAEAGVGEEWVGRFAAPVEAERSQIVGRARELVYAKPRRGDSSEPLGLAVRWNLADRGVRLTNDEYDDGWTAYQVADHAWMVTFTFVSRKRTQEAEWEVDLATGELVSRNRLGSDLGYVEPGRRRRSMASLQPVPLLGTKGARRPGAPTAPARPAEPDGDPAPDRPAKKAKRVAKRSVGGRTTLPAKKAVAARKVAARKAAATKAAATKAAATKAPATKAPARKAPATRAARARSTDARASGGAGARATVKKAGPSSKAAATRGVAKTAGTTPAGKAAPASRRAAKSARRAASRTRAGGGQEAPPAVLAVVERPEPNELSQRRLQMATGAPRPSSAGRRPAPTAAPAASRAAPPPASVRIAAARSTDVPAPARSEAPGPVPAAPEAPAPAPAPAPARPAPAPAPAGPAPAPARPAAVPAPARPAPPPAAAPPRRRERAPSLDVDVEADPEIEADARRAERRRARAAARAAAGSDEAAAARRPAEAPRPAPTRAPADVPPGDGRVVTIRATRAAPPRAGVDEADDVVLDRDRPPLRPAQPATQPRRRRFTRSG